MTTPSEEEARAALIAEARTAILTMDYERAYQGGLVGRLADALASRVSTPPSEEVPANDNVLFYLVHEASGYLLLVTSDKTAALAAMQDGDYMVEREIPVPAVPVLPTEPEEKP